MEQIMSNEPQVVVSQAAADMIARLRGHAMGLREYERYPAGNRCDMTNADCVSYGGLLDEAAATIEILARHAASARQSSGVGEEEICSAIYEGIGRRLISFGGDTAEAGDGGVSWEGWKAHAAQYPHSLVHTLEPFRIIARAIAPSLSSTFAMGVEAAARVADYWVPPRGGFEEYSAATAHRICREIAERIRALSPPSDSLDGMREALEKYDAALAKCPFSKRKSPPSSKPCPDCGATASESCRKLTSAAFTFVSAARQALHPGAKEGGA